VRVSRLLILFPTYRPPPPERTLSANNDRDDRRRWNPLSSSIVPISAVTIAELAAGPHATDDPDERARRQDRLQWAAATWDPLPLDADAARAYGRVFAAARAAGRTGSRRFADLLIAATAVANDVPLYTRDTKDFSGLDEGLRVEVI
jgi:hypothetical protein